MAVILGFRATAIQHSAPVALTRTSGQASTSSTSILHLRRKSVSSRSLNLSPHHVPNRGGALVRGSLTREGENVRELASEKAVESGQQVADDTSKLANGLSAVSLEAKSDDASDAASDNSDVRENVVDVASDMAVDSSADVDELAKKDAAPLAEKYGRSVEDAVEALESKAAEVSDREVRKEA